MERSAMPFWKWALTPQKVSCCCASWQVLESVVEEATVVAVVVLDLHTMFGGKGLEGAFGCYGLFG
jgi:hypothetical protein